MRHIATRSLFILAGWISLLLGIVGAFLPILPTTPLVILAAFFFSKGSPRLHHWLLTRPYLGSMIVEWERHGIIRLRAKLLSTVVIIPLFGYTLGFVDVNLVIKSGVTLIGLLVLTFIWTRPSVPPTGETGGEPPETGA